MKLLLTGATGFVGRNLLLRALREGRYEKIWAPVRSVNKLRAQLRAEGIAEWPANLVAIEASARDWNLGEAAEADHVLHSAGVLFSRREFDYFETNVEGTLRLLRAVRPTSRVVILSSLAASGPCQEGEEARRESSPESPVTGYGRSKLEMERRVAAEFADRSLVVLRPPMVLGPRDSATLPLFKMAKGKLHFKPGFGTKWYSFVAVSDLVDAIFAAWAGEGAWSKPGVRTYFVTSGKPFSDRDLVTGAARALNRKGWLLPVPQGVLRLVSRLVDSVPAWADAIPSLTADRANEIWPDRWVVSSDAFQQDFHWKPVAELLSVLTETGTWYRETGQLA